MSCKEADVVRSTRPEGPPSLSLVLRKKQLPSVSSKPELFTGRDCRGDKHRTVRRTRPPEPGIKERAETMGPVRTWIIHGGEVAVTTRKWQVRRARPPDPGIKEKAETMGPVRTWIIHGGEVVVTTRKWQVRRARPPDPDIKEKAVSIGLVEA